MAAAGNGSSPFFLQRDPFYWRLGEAVTSSLRRNVNSAREISRRELAAALSQGKKEEHDPERG
jgi:hypothetical protein